MAADVFHAVAGRLHYCPRSSTRPEATNHKAFHTMIRRASCKQAEARRTWIARAESGAGRHEPAGLDANQLQTRLNVAIAAEHYGEAALIRDQLQGLGGGDRRAVLDWRQLGTPDWLAKRAEQLGFEYPTEVQRSSAPDLTQGRDAIIQAQTGSGKTLSYLLPLLSTLDYPPDVYPDDLKGPQLIILVPTKELGVQQALLAFQLLGGSINRGIPGNRANLFTYTGPRGIQVRGVLDKEEVLLAKNGGSLRNVHVVIGTPDAVAEAAVAPNAVPILTAVKALAVDEADACLQEHAKSMEFIMAETCCQQGWTKPQVVFAGATVRTEACALAEQMGWLHKPVHVTVGGTGSVPQSVSHSYIATTPQRKLAILARQIRQDLLAQGNDLGPPRVVVFAESEAAAQAAAEPLRGALWGDHKLAVLLPHGEEPIQAMHDFRDNKSTFLLATPAAARGLDLPAVSHIYNLSPPSDAVEYLHRAGRVGRIGANVPGIVTTLVDESEQQQLQDISKELHLDLREQQEPVYVPESKDDPETAKRNLEDLYRLM